MPTSSISAIGGLPPPTVLPLPAMGTGGAAAPPPATDEAGKAAQQFEAILLRQFLAPAIQPMMGGNSIDGSDGDSGGGGGGVYSFMLTDVMANAMSQGGGLGLARILKRQFTKNSAPVAAAGATTDHGAPVAPKLTLPKGLVP